MDLLLHHSVIVVDSEGTRHVCGNVLEPVVLSSGVTGQVYEAQLILPAALDPVDGTEIGTLWSAATAPLDDFDFLYVISNRDSVYLQLTVADGHGSEENLVLPLRKDVPFLLGADDSYRGVSPDFAAGTLDTIDKLMVQNLSGDVATIKVLAVT